ncbi:hypothetical protein TNCV_122561 [Trichonephila clavipes]|nr:hypothetical protein TNCV_122561 [Trichonephila clavipes]
MVSMLMLGKTRPLPGHKISGSMKSEIVFILECLYPPRSPTREAVCRSSGKYQARRLPEVHPEYSTTVSGRGSNGERRPPFSSLREERGHRERKSGKWHKLYGVPAPERGVPPHQNFRKRAELVILLKIFILKDIIKNGQNNFWERRQIESVGRRDSRTTFLRSDWPRPFARREVGVEMDWVDPKINDLKGDLELKIKRSHAKIGGKTNFE